MKLAVKDRNRLWLDLTAILGAALLITLPVLLFGVPKGNDLPQHYQFAVTFYNNARDGVFFPGWASGVNSGFGDVGVRFYPPLSYYLLDFFRTLFGNWFYASVAAFCFLFFLGGIGVYFWSREWFSGNAALAAAIVYIFVPYHVNEIFNAFTYAEFAGGAILPFCFLFVTRVCHRGKVGSYSGLAISFALLILTHLPLTVIGSIALLVYSLATLRKESWSIALVRLSGAVGAALLATSFYWVRVVSELPFLNHDAPEYLSQEYDFRHNFLLSFFTASADAYAERSLMFLDLMFLVTAAMTIPFMMTYFWKERSQGHGGLAGVMAVVILGLFCATPLSYPVWNNIEILQKVQFPWRWMIIISLAAAVFVAAGFDQLVKLFRSKLRPLALIGFGLLIAGCTFTVAQVIRPAIYIDQADFESSVSKLATAQSYDCWWPIWAQKEAIVNTTKVSANSRNVEIERWQPTERAFQISAGAATEIRVATFYYPNWHAEVNHREVPVSPDETGAITIPIPADESLVKLNFIEPAIEIAARYISLACWSIFGLFGIYYLGLRKKSKLN